MQAIELGAYAAVLAVLVWGLRRIARWEDPMQPSRYPLCRVLVAMAIERAE